MFQRDWTVNALLFDPCAGVIYDYVGGVADAREGRLRTVGPALASFAADPVRILRGVRLAASTGGPPRLAYPTCIVSGRH